MSNIKEPKLTQEYKDLYAEIPNDPKGRLDYLLSHIKFPVRNPVDVQNFISNIQKIKWKHKEFVFYILPKSTPRPRASRTGSGKMIFYVKGANDHKQFLKYALRNEDIELIATPMKFHIRAFLPIPQSMKAHEKVAAELGFVRPITKPDWDNLAKTYCDMMSSLVIQDDRLIIEGSLKKYYSVKPRIEIDLWYMEDYDCDYNRKKLER